MHTQTTTAHNRPAPMGNNASPLIEVKDLNLWYGEKHALIDVNFDLFPNEILAFIGPSGCGKSTALKCLNRMHDYTPDVRIQGSIHMTGHSINASDIDPPLHRRRFGWVAQKPNPFPTSVYDNVAYGARIHGLAKDQADLDEQVETCLRQAMMWDEVKDHLHKMDGTELSGGQQQRLCIARALATRPEVLLMDEPTGSIDPIATQAIEELMLELRSQLSVVVVTHSMMEAKRIADRVAYFHLGKLLEVGPTDLVFKAARSKEARDFISGAFG